jgi:hypothetical protein
MTATAYRSRLREGPYGFADLLHAEWTKFRTVRGWVIGVIAGALAIVAFALAPGQQGSCNVAGCTIPVGPGGHEVSDGFYSAPRPCSQFRPSSRSPSGRYSGAGPGRSPWSSW